jgi:RHS repeat-associated protein
MNIKELSLNGSATYKPNEYLYNGKMMQDEMGLGWYDYGARFYDPVLGRFHVPDPLIELHYNYTPFAYCYNNPVRLIDQLGLDSTDATKSNAPVTNTTGNPVTEAAISLVAPAGEAINTFISGYTDQGKPAEAVDYIQAACDLFTFGVLFSRGGEGEAGVKESPPIQKYYKEGMAREKQVKTELEAANPESSVLTQRLLRDASGAKAVDPLTGQGRILDIVVVNKGMARDAVEVTSLGASKTAQIAKEMRIRQNGGTFIKDPNTGKLMHVPATSRIVRRN